MDRNRQPIAANVARYFCCNERVDGFILNSQGTGSRAWRGSRQRSDPIRPVGLWLAICSILGIGGLMKYHQATSRCRKGAVALAVLITLWPLKASQAQKQPSNRPRT